jgi:hypothetical protein
VNVRQYGDAHKSSSKYLKKGTVMRESYFVLRIPYYL